MRPLDRLARWLRRWRPADRVAADLRRELDAHLALEAEDLRDQGAVSAVADRAARLTLGNPALVSEHVRELSPWIMWERLQQDVRYAVRGLARRPAFAVTAVLSLALGIGANTAIFSVANAAMLRSLPVTRPDELALLTNGEIGNFSYPIYRSLRERTAAFSDLMAASSAQRYVARVGGDTEQVFVKMVSGNYFRGLGVTPAAGRVLADSDELEPVAVLSDAYWQRRFARAPDVIGRPARINGVNVTIVGVARAGFTGEMPGESPEIWTSLALQPQTGREERGFTWLYLIGRRAPDVTLAHAPAEIAALRANLQPNAPDDTPFKEVIVSSGARGSTRLGDRVMAPLLALAGAAALVLLIACLNLGGLLLTRDDARRQEISIRLAVGASAPRIVRQLMTESLVLAVMGGAAGLLVAHWAARTLTSIVGVAGLDLVLDTSLDARVLLFAGVTSAAAALIFGLAPALRAAGHSDRGAFTPTTRVVGWERRWGLRAGFIVSQVALTLMLLAAATMFVRTLRNLERQDLGFARDARLTVNLALERGGPRPDLGTLVPQLIERLQAIPGVARATTAAFGVLSQSGGGVNGLQATGFDPADPDDRRARANWVGPGYFQTTGIRLLAGRDLDATDTARAAKVAVVNEPVARHLFGAVDAVGRHFTFNRADYEIVGVAAAARLQLREAAPRMIYFSILQGGPPPAVVEIRSAAPDMTLVAAAVRQALPEVDARLSAREILSVEDQVSRLLGAERLVARLSGALGILTLLLACIGIYGTIAFTAARRTKEIGVRLALGSRRTSVIWMVIRDVLILMGAGMTIGAAGVIGVGSVLDSLLYQVAPLDAIALVVAVGCLSIVALAAAALPSIRASRLDPASVLREP